MFPRAECDSCGRRCSFKQQAAFKRDLVFAWARRDPLPECGDYQERYWKGRLVRI